MNSIERIAQKLYEYEMAGLVERDCNKVLALLADDIYGIGMGEQGIVSSKEEILSIMQSTIKHEDQAAYSIILSDQKIIMLTDTSAFAGAKVTLIKEEGERRQKSEFMQTLVFIFEKNDWRICSLHASPLLINEESIEAYPMTFVDNVFDQLKSEVRGEVMEFMNDSLSGGILGTYIDDGRYPLYFANDIIIQSLGYEKEEFYHIFEKDSFRLVDPDDFDVVKNTMEQHLQDKTDFGFQFRLLKKDGSKRWTLAKSRFTKDLKNRDIILSVLTDISELVTIQRDLEDKNVRLAISEERFRLVFRKTSKVVFEYDIETKRITVIRPDQNTVEYEKAIFEAGEILMDGVLEQESKDILRTYAQKVLLGEEETICTVKACKEDGKEIWGKITLIGMKKSNGRIWKIVGIVEDVTLQKETEIAYHREEQYCQAILADTMVNYEINFTKDVIENYQLRDNQFTEPLQGEGYVELFGRILTRRVAFEDREQFIRTFSKENILHSFESGIKELRLEYAVCNKNGEQVWVYGIMHLIFDKVSNDKKGYWYVTNIDKRKQEELLLRRKVDKDPLTQVYNKTATEIRVKDLLCDTVAGQRCAFLMIDVDFFKEVNDTYGHPFGDKILCQVASILKQSFRDSDVVGRLGGDEFGVFIYDILEHRLEMAVRNICRRVAFIFRKENGDPGVTCSIGIAVSERGNKKFDQLYKEADIALYEMKRGTRNGYRLFSEK